MFLVLCRDSGMKQILWVSPGVPAGTGAALPASCPRADSLGWMVPIYVIPYDCPLSNLVQCKASLTMAGGWTWMIFKISSNPGEGGRGRWKSRVKHGRGCWSSFAVPAAPECIILAAGKQSLYHIIQQDFLMDLKPKPAKSFSQKSRFLQSSVMKLHWWKCLVLVYSSSKKSV